jgi:hypothetical protein
LKSLLLKNIGDSTPKEGIRLNRRMIVFLICIATSAFFWLILSLSKTYTLQLNYPVNYENFPLDKVVANPLPKQVMLTVNTNGFNYLIYLVTRSRKTLSINVKQLRSLYKKNHYYILTNSGIDTISSQFSEEMKIIKIDPDTIFLNFNKKINKKVPVIVNFKIDYFNNYQPSDSMVLTPAFVTISGVKEVIDKVNSVETKPIVLKKVKDNISLQVDILQTHELKLLEVIPASVKVELKISKYTEGSIELPIEFKNVPAGVSIKTFPDKVTIKYTVALENYDKVNAIDFKAIVDYVNISKGSNKLKVELKKTPAEIHAPKISPEKVEFIIRK